MPDDLTGEQIAETRKDFNITRTAFAVITGVPVNALRRIELENKWKDGEQEKVRTGLHRLLTNPPPGRRKGETGSERVDRLEAMLRANGHLLREQGDNTPSSVAGGGEWPAPPTWQVTGPDTPETRADETSYDLDVLQQIDYEQDVVEVIPDAPELPVSKVVSNSEISTWLRCRRKWWLAWYRKLALAKTDYSGPRAIGNRVHRALAAWYVPEGEIGVDPREALEKVIAEDWAVIAEELGGDEDRLTLMAEKFNDACNLERAMIEGYVEWIAETAADADLEIIASETAIHKDLDVYTHGGTLTRIRLAGLLDVRARRKSDGALVFIDHKTVGNLTDPRKTLHMDPQMMFYHLLEWLNTDDAANRCDGALYSMLRKIKRTDRAKPPFYDRVPVRHNVIEIQSHLDKVMGAVQDILAAEDQLNRGVPHRTAAYPTNLRDCSYSCDFFPVCNLLDDGSRAEDALASLYVEVDPLERYETKGVLIE